MSNQNVTNIVINTRSAKAAFVAGRLISVTLKGADATLDGVVCSAATWDGSTAVAAGVTVAKGLDLATMGAERGLKGLCSWLDNAMAAMTNDDETKAGEATATSAFKAGLKG